MHFDSLASTQSTWTSLHELRYYQPQLKIVQASEGYDVQLEFHEWQDEYMTVCIRVREFNPQQHVLR